MFQDTIVSLGDLVAVAVLLDLIAQFLIFHEIYPGAALLIGPLLVGITVRSFQGARKPAFREGRKPRRTSGTNPAKHRVSQTMARPYIGSTPYFCD
jgi:hypothetical protein